MNFNQKVYYFTKKIPYGRVATYGQIAALCGNVRAGRLVGWALHHIADEIKIPWHRVINRHGQISTTCLEHPAELQKKLLEAEGIEVKKINGLWQVDLEKYLWRPKSISINIKQ